MTRDEGRAAVHPWAWWAWALAVTGGVALTTNPLPILLIAGAVVAVVTLRRTESGWARSIAPYLVLTAVVLGIRLFFHIAVGAPIGSTVLFRLPTVTLPSWAAGIRIGGEVTAEGLLFTVYDALRLAAMLLCLGAGNALANPRRALRSVPAALYEASTAAAIAFSVAPQLIESGQRIRRAQRLRGGRHRGLRAIGALVVPVLGDAIDRSIALAAGMEARGFGRTRGVEPQRGLVALTLTGALLAMFGVFRLFSGGLVDGPLMGAVGLASIVLGLRASGRRLGVTRYRPDPWLPRDTAVAAVGVGAFALMLLIGRLDPTVLIGPVDPITAPSLPPLAVIAAVLVVAPAWLGRPAKPTLEPAGPDASADTTAERLRPRPTRVEVVA